MIFTSRTFYDCISAAAERASDFGVSPDERTIIFCEDKLTLSIELALAEKTGGTFAAEVSSFGRYAESFGKGKPVLSKEGGAMAVRKILSSSDGKLQVFKGVSPSLAAELCELIAQLKSAKVTYDALFSCVPSCPKNVGAKVGDIAEVYRSYEEFLKERDLKDSANSLEFLPELIEKDENVKKTRVIIAAYTSVTRQTCDVIKSLYHSALSCDFFVVTGENKDIYTNEFFEFVKGLDKSEPIVVKESLSPECEAIASGLFNPAQYAKVGLYSDKVAIFEAKNVYAEAEYIANRIRYEVIERGIRYKDIAVAVGNLPEYSLAIKRNMESYSIPYFSDEKRLLTDHPIIKLMDALLKNCERRGDTSEIKRVISNALFIPEKEIADEMIASFSVLSLTSKAFLDGENQIYEDIYQSAKRDAVISFYKKFRTKNSAREYVKGIREFVEKSGIGENFKKLSDDLAEIGADGERSFNDAAFEKFDGVLSEIEGVLGDEILSVGEMRKIILSGAEACEISILPEYNDCVYVTELKDCRFKKYKILFAAGLSGDVPFVKGDAAVLLDSDIGKLEDLSVKVEPKIRVVNSREKEAVALSLLSFEDALYLSYSNTSPSGKPCAASEIIGYIRNIFSDEKKALRPFGRGELEIARQRAVGERKDRMEAYDYIGLRPALFSLVKDGDDFKNGAIADFEAASSFYEALRGYDGGKHLKTADALLGKVNRQMVVTADIPPENYFNGGNVSASLLETFYSCPYKNFLKYGVGLADSLTPDMQALDFGNVLHAVAEIFVKRIGEVNSDKDAADIAAEIYDGIFEDKKYARFLRRKDYTYSVSLMRKEAQKLCVRIYDEFLNSSFLPVGEEVWFADWGEYKALPLKTKQGKYKLFGKTDRLDKYNNYVRIIDYKTGNADKKASGEEFYTGRHIQLYLYMNAFVGKDETPAGAYYYALSDGFYKKGEKGYSMYGYTLSDDEILSATDKAFFDKRESDLIDVKIKSTKNGDKKSGGAVDERTLRGYMKYAKLMAEKGVDEVVSGVIAATPYEKACEYCEYKPICRYDEDVDDRTRKTGAIDERVILAAVEEEDGI
ncbi:MAG: PD-(D/E)XK nuclease family protein [Clostridia bacterium]|nr:PD-(D/E)XK nuclease family protein [Clostridia bacterium]